MRKRIKNNLFLLTISCFIRVLIISIGINLFFYTRVIAATNDSFLNILQYPDTDLSLTYINFIFGPLSQQGSALITNTFSFLVVKLLALSGAVGSIMASWVVVTGTMRSGTEGVFLGQKWGSPYVLFRGAVGLGLLTPDAYGYALIQKIFMNAIIMGIALANYLWGIVIVNYEQGNTLLAQSTATPSDKSLTYYFIEQAVLLNYLDQTQNITGYNLTGVGTKAITLHVVSGKEATADPGPLDLYELTGDSYSAVNDNMLTAVSQILAYYYNDPLVKLMAGGLIVLGNNPVGTVQTTIDQSALMSTSGQTISTEDINIWMNTNFQMTHTALSVINPATQNSISQYLQQGWLTAGSIYWKLSVGGKTQTYADSLKIASSGSVPFSTDLSSWLNALNATVFSASPSPALVSNLTALYQNLQTYGKNPAQGQLHQDSKYEGAVAGIDFSFNSLQNVYESVQQGKDPLITFIQDCQHMLESIIIFLMASLLTMTVVSLFALFRYQLPFVHQIVFFCGSILMIILSFSLIFVPPAVFGGYYLPLVPMIIFSASGFAWLFKVVEAIVAAPIVAVALIQPTDDDFGKAESAIVMLFSVILKPALMIIGFTVALRLTIIGFVVYSYAFSAITTFNQFTFTASSFMIDKILAYILLDQMVVYMVVAIVSRSFSLIYALPDQVFSWIGERPDDSDVHAIVNETKSGAEQGIKMMSQLFEVGVAVGKVGMESFQMISNAKQKP
jgi:hypothetical protein